MRRCLFLLMLLMLGWSTAAQTPEELYADYITPETRAILERAREAERRAEEAEAAAKAQKTLALCGAILIGLVPLCVIGRRILRKKTWKDNPAGTVRALGVGLVGGVCLFALNYGIFLLKIRMGDAFNSALAFLLVSALIAGSVYLIRSA